MKAFALGLAASVLLAAAAAHTPRAWAVDNLSSKDAPDLTSVRAKIKAKDYKGAIAELTPMLVTNQHADVYNLMGFSLRKTGDYKQAYTFYRKALDFNPEHKGALERCPTPKNLPCWVRRVGGSPGSNRAGAEDQLRRSNAIATTRGGRRVARSPAAGRNLPA
jgi:tetratricopeptide (TPR) repeat protein